MERDRLQAEVETTRAGIAEAAREADQQRARVAAELAALRDRVVETDETAILQEVGVYRYQHPLDDAVAYRSELSRLQAQIKAMARKDGGAISATTTWQVNGSAAQGRKLVSDRPARHRPRW